METKPENMTVITDELLKEFCERVSGHAAEIWGVPDAILSGFFVRPVEDPETWELMGVGQRPEEGQGIDFTSGAALAIKFGNLEGIVLEVTPNDQPRVLAHHWAV